MTPRVHEQDLSLSDLVFSSWVFFNEKTLAKLKKPCEKCLRGFLS